MFAAWSIILLMDNTFKLFLVSNANRSFVWKDSLALIEPYYGLVIVVTILAKIQCLLFFLTYALTHAFTSADVKFRVANAKRLYVLQHGYVKTEFCLSRCYGRIPCCPLHYWTWTGSIKSVMFLSYCCIFLTSRRSNLSELLYAAAVKRHSCSSS